MLSAGIPFSVPVGGYAGSSKDEWASLRRRPAVMTVPEGKRRKTDTTQDVVIKPRTVAGEREAAESEAERDTGQASGRTMREAMEEAEVQPEDYEE